MRVYSVHLRRNGIEPDRDLVLVRDGFSWPAFLFTFVWAGFNRMWLPAAVLLAVVLASGAVFDLVLGDRAVDTVLTVGVSILIGYLAGDIRRWWLNRQGYREVAVVAGRDHDEAMRRFLDGAEIDASGIYA